MNRANRQRVRGLSLIEAVISMVLVSVTLVAAVQTVGAAARTRVVTIRHQAAHLLATELLAEILQQDYADPDGGIGLGPDLGEATRLAFDDVDDYHNWLEYPPTSRLGAARSQFSDWARRVEVSHVSSDVSLGTFLDTGRKKIIVRVWHDSDLLCELHGLRSAATPPWEEIP